MMSPRSKRRGARGPLLAAAAFLIAASGPGERSKDLQTVKEARSVAAEWALTNRLAAAGRVTPTYAEAMARQAKRQLASALKTVSDPQGPAAHELARLTRLPANASPDVLARSARRLLAIEAGLEDR